MISCFKGKFKVTSPRGYRVLGGKEEYHGGLDLVGIDDKTVYAIADGIVDAVPYEANGFGYYVRQKLPDGRRIYYGHMAKGSIVVKAGQQIKKGDKLGIMGSTGRSTGAHTHLEIRIPGTSKTSLDISEFTGIPNKTGTYEYKEENDMKFKDVPDTHWAAKAIEELSEKGIIKGYEDGTFKPEQSVTRAEVAVMISRAMEAK
jgi:murein DD-endopeptidase MepM/ murein hydrolase activator NlpD